MPRRGAAAGAAIPRGQDDERFNSCNALGADGGRARRHAAPRPRALPRSFRAVDQASIS